MNEFENLHEAHDLLSRERIELTTVEFRRIEVETHLKCLKLALKKNDVSYIEVLVGEFQLKLDRLNGLLKEEDGN